jgi:CheY-like chemotaxis protein
LNDSDRSSRKPKVSIIEDHDDNRELLRFILDDFYEVESFRDGATGLAGIRESPPDIILLDISMPNVGGLEVIREIRSDPRIRHIPVIAVTAHTMKGDRELILSYGFSDYVAKPIVDLDSFQQLIQEHIRNG